MGKDKFMQVRTVASTEQEKVWTSRAPNYAPSFERTSASYHTCFCKLEQFCLTTNIAEVECASRVYIETESESLYRLPLKLYVHTQPEAKPRVQSVQGSVQHDVIELCSFIMLQYSIYVI